MDLPLHPLGTENPRAPGAARLETPRKTRGPTEAPGTHRGPRCDGGQRGPDESEKGPNGKLGVTRKKKGAEGSRGKKYNSIN